MVPSTAVEWDEETAVYLVVLMAVPTVSTMAVATVSTMVAVWV